jgi:beta-phosphoglucomutase-like phosphatase (HAD superfamily)
VIRDTRFPQRAAVGILNADISECTLVGDSAADVFAGLLAGVAVVGYANGPGKAQALADVQVTAGHGLPRRDHRGTPPQHTSQTAELSPT